MAKTLMISMADTAEEIVEETAEEYSDEALPATEDEIAAAKADLLKWREHRLATKKARRKKAFKDFWKRNRGKFIGYLIAAAVIAVGVALAIHFGTNKETEIEELKVYRFNEEEGTGVFTITNGSLTLEFNPATTQFTITDKNKNVWNSCSIATDATHAELKANVIVSYIDANGVLQKMNSYSESVKRGNYEVEKDEANNRIIVKYTIGKVDPVYHVPKVMTKERYDEVFEQIKAKKEEVAGDEAMATEQANLQSYWKNAYIMLTKDKLDRPGYKGEAVPTLSGTGSKFFLHQSTTGQYEVVAITSGYYSTNYYSMGVANSTLKLYSSSNYAMGDDEVQSVIYSQLTCETPVISFDNTTSQVTITCATEGATIHYTMNGDEPTSSSPSTPNPFTISNTTTVKAIATLTGYLDSEKAERTIEKVATPSIQDNGSNAVSITCATPGATIYYAIGSSPVVGTSPTYSAPLTEGVSGQTIYAIAVKENMLNSAEVSETVMLTCDAPVITRNGNSGFIATCAFPATGVTIYYTTDGSTTPTTSTPTHINSGGSVAIALPVTVKAIAVATNYNNSTVTTTTVTQGMGGSGTETDPYTIEYQSDVADFITKANDPALADKYYKVISADPLDFSGAAAITQPFSGNFDGNLQTLTGLQHALFNTVDGGVVKNVMLKGVDISSTADTVGAVTNIAKGYSRIYNCGILPTTANFPEGTHSSVSTSGACYI